MPPGVYRVVLDVDDEQFTSTLRIEADPNVPAGQGAGDDEEEFVDPRRVR
jgi:hypothetical protein